MKTYICGNCGKAASELDKFCQYCGGKIIEKPAENFKACKKCGTEIFNDDVFCPNCGERVNNAAPPPVQTPVYAPPVQHSGGTSTAVIVLLILLIVAIIGAGIIFLGRDMGFNPFSSKPAQTVVQNSTKATPIPDIPVTVPPVTPPPHSDINDPYGYLFPSNTMYISDDYLRTKTQAEVRLILNEIYARHGYSFESREYAMYFGSKQWYIPRGKTMPACEAEFNNYERINKETIVKFEMSRGWR